MIARIGTQILSKREWLLNNKLVCNFSVIKKKKKGDNTEEKKRLDDNQQLLLDKFKARKTTRYAQTKDGYRVDVGLVITRSPIFLNLREYEL